MAELDKMTERMFRGLARHTSRRSMFSLLGGALTGAAAIPLLPVSRAQAANPTNGPANGTNMYGMPVESTGNLQDPGDPTSCDYWRYCAIDGFLCSCCGGTANACPPGTEMSPITWIGTCQNPADNRSYIVSYNDCCGKSSCGRCLCNRNEGDRPVVRPQANNDIDWCLGTASSIYNCSTAVIIGVAMDQR